LDLDDTLNNGHGKSKTAKGVDGRLGQTAITRGVEVYVGPKTDKESNRGTESFKRDSESRHGPLKRGKPLKRKEEKALTIGIFPLLGLGGVKKCDN